MRTVILASMRGHARRYVAAALAIGLGVMFVSTALLVLSAVKAGLTNAVAAQYERADLVVVPGSEAVSPDVVDRLRQLDGVAGAAGVAHTGVRVVYRGDVRPGWLALTALPADPALRWQQVSAGRLPRAPGEIAIDAARAEDHQLAPGSSLTVGDAEGGRETATVVGVLAARSFGDEGSAVATEETIARWSGGPPGYSEVLVRTTADRHQDRAGVVAAALRKLAGRDASVLTADARAAEVARGLTGGVDVLGVLLLGFAGVATFVATLVVANTFTIVLAQRTRELALLRCVGARGGQLVRSVVAESAVLGAVASIGGAAAGTGAAVLAARVLTDVGVGIPMDGVHVSPALLALPVAVGIATTVVAALAPARRATRVSPLAALRPESAPDLRSRTGHLRLILAAGSVVVGTAVMLLGARFGGIVAGVAGGALSFLGVLASGPLLVPAVVRLLGLATRAFGGVPSRLAVSNAVRNPRRTAATATALLVGVTLIVLMTVGAASAQRTVQQMVNSEFPLDLSLSAPERGIPDRTVQGIRAVDGLASSAILRGATVTTAAAGATADGGRSATVRVVGVDPAAATAVLRSPEPVAGLHTGVALVSPSVAERLRVRSGGDLALVFDGRQSTLRAAIVRSNETPDVVLTQADLARLAPDAGTTGLWARVAAGASPRAVLADVEEAAADVDGLEIGGGAPERVFYDQFLDVLLLVAACLLAISVVIALVGVGNTLSLSVIERTREQALLRALGLTRGQLRRTLAVEALLVAAVAVVVGLPLGVLYGWAGTAAMLSAAVDDDVLLAVPAGRLALIAAVALAAGLLASVLPARRAARVPPAAAIATE